MSIAPAFRERKEVRSFHRIRHANSGRILNLIDLSDAATAAVQGSDAEVKPNRIFHANVLNYSILAKHNVRDHERELFTRAVQVATKVFIPFDPKRLDIGGRSFFIEEHQFKDHLKELVHIDYTQSHPNTLHDLKVLDTLSRAPTLDPFIVTESLRTAGIAVEPSFFADGYAMTSKASSDVFQVFNPLLQKALGKMASAEELSRFVDQVWNVTAATTTNPFLEALQIPRSEWANVIFAWKALIYYDIVSRNSPQRLQLVLNVLKGTEPKRRAGGADMANIAMLKRDFARNLYKLHDGSTGYIQAALQRIVGAILSENGASAISDSLRNMADNISMVGTNVVLFDQVTSYFLFLYPKPSVDIVDPAELEMQLANLCEIVRLRDKLRLPQI
ncbi:MAG TPA: hypothetical protein VMU01_01170 [Rhizomicrobium sp.]|nr:hypothetical protein [Rhizomicrobium sp.]